MFFGEQLPEKFHDFSEKEFVDCDLLIVIGTSMNVKPFKCLPGKFVFYLLLLNVLFVRNLLNFSFLLRQTCTNQINL